jgi:putative FmdB family regulatory protein
MPTYEFTCPNGHDFEKFFRTISGGASELPCPVCGAIAVRKISAGAGLMFKGTGFYITDYGKDGKKDQHLPRKSSNGSDGASPSASSDGGGSGDSKSAGESKSSESKSSEPKSSSSDSKPAESKPAPKPSEKKPSAPTRSSSSE